MSRRIPDAMLERYLADALDAQARGRLEATLAESPADQARLSELRADSAAFLLRQPPGPFVARLQEAPQKVWWRRWPVLLAPPLAVAMLTLLAFQPQIERLLQPLMGDPYTAKGSVVLVLHRKTPEGSALVSPEVPLAPGDVIRFQVTTSGEGHIAVLGKDARGTVTVYYPYGGEDAAPCGAGKSVLEGAVELDDTLGREDVYALFSEHPFELGWAVWALKEGRELREVAPKGVSVGHTFFLKK